MSAGRPPLQDRESSSAMSATMMGTSSLASLGSLTIGGNSQSASGPMGKDGEAVPVGFDEGVLRGLCEMDVSSAISFSTVGLPRLLRP
jgi:hypothetical protein